MMGKDDFNKLNFIELKIIHFICIKNKINELEINKKRKKLRENK